MKFERTRYVSILVAALLGCVVPSTTVRAELNLLADMVLDEDALLMPRGSTYGRSINGAAFQAESLLTFGGYQYATWYHPGVSDETIHVARRNLSGNTWGVVDTGRNFNNGDATAWDAHNVISMGVGDDGRMHFSWDMHNNTLRYMNTVTGVATNPGTTAWNASIFNAERNGLNAGGPAIGDVTYPQFTTHPTTGELVMNFRTGSSGNGNVFVATYDTSTGLWNSHHRIIDGTTPIPYDDDFGNPSNERNAYVNGLDIDATGRMHVTWVWRETATGGSNHDVMYAYSDDGGDTWRNNAGTMVGTVASPMNISSPGIIVVLMDRGNTLMNQQTQAVDGDGRVHMVMWHRRDAAAKVDGFTTTPADYFHYFRDPASAVWTRTELPTTRAVGSRPDMAYDADGNLYVAYVSPGPGDGQGVTANYYTEGDLIIATASKAAGYTDWSIDYTDVRDFVGEPRIDQKRLTENGVISVILQENDDVNTGVTATPLHVLEFNKLAKNLVWAGNVGTNWDTGTNWDSDGNDTGDAEFVSGNRVTFDDGAVSSAVSISNPVAPSSVTFRNSMAKSFTVTGAAIGGAGGLAITGGGMVTLANAGNTYTGETNITSGKLVLTGDATISASPAINVAAGGTLDVTGTNSGGVTLSNQTLEIDGDVDGHVVATNNSSVNVNSTNSLNGNLTVQSGSLAQGAGRIAGNLVAAGGTVRVGGMGLPTADTTVIDDFSAPGLSEYTLTRVSDNAIAETNLSLSDGSGALVASYAGTVNQPEQVLLLRNDTGLVVGQTLLVDVSMPTTTAQMDLGIAVSETVNPTAASPGDTDTRDSFDWASISVRPTGNEIRNNRSINGTVTTGANVLTNVNETNVAQLFVERTSSTNFTIGYINTSSVRTNAASFAFTETNAGTAIGFYADLRSHGGSLGSFDNLRIFHPNQLVTLGETLTVDGDYTQSAGATLALDIHSPTAHDLLDVAGIINAGGTLSVSLVAGAPVLQAGNEFDLLDFASLSGVFDAVLLPALGAGLVWDNSLLLSSGVLKVAAGLAGDYNGNGQVDAADYVVWRKLIGQVGAGLMADGNSDLRVDDSDYALWKANLGATLGGSSANVVDGEPVPEPSTAVLGAILLGALLVCRAARP